MPGEVRSTGAGIARIARILANSATIEHVRIAEIYRSIQGEGLLTGAESVFVRTSGCNLRCGFCDTPYTSWEPEGDDLAVADVLDAVERLEAPHVVITGGEPLLWAEVAPLSDELR